MSPIDQKTRPLKENHLIQRVLHRPVELAPFHRTWPVGCGLLWWLIHCVYCKTGVRCAPQRSKSQIPVEEEGRQFENSCS